MKFNYSPLPEFSDRQEIEKLIKSESSKLPSTDLSKVQWTPAVLVEKINSKKLFLSKAISSKI
jgi:hypothetical protein